MSKDAHYDRLYKKTDNGNYNVEKFKDCDQEFLDYYNKFQAYRSGKALRNLEESKYPTRDRKSSN